MGIRFVHLTEDQQAQVVEFSEDAMKKAIKSAGDLPTDDS
jgi:hypothetical protein